MEFYQVYCKCQETCLASKIIPNPHQLNILTNRDANDEREVHLH